MIMRTFGLFAASVATALFLPTITHALELDVSLAPAVWQYSENMGRTVGFTGNTPIQSSARGSGMLTDMNIAQDLGALRLSLGGEWFGSVGSTAETWNMPTQQQRNHLSVKHSEFRAAVHGHWDALSPLFAFGVWGSMQSDTQQRSNFSLNGTPRAVGTVREQIQVSWAGLSLMGESENRYFRLRVDAGMPLSVKTTNDVIPGVVFRTKRGVRWHVMANYRIFGEETGMATRLLASYRFRQLGNEVQTNALWPKNQWQVVTFGMQQAW